MSWRGDCIISWSTVVDEEGGEGEALKMKKGLWLTHRVEYPGVSTSPSVDGTQYGASFLGDGCGYVGSEQPVSSEARLIRARRFLSSCRTSPRDERKHEPIHE